MAVSAIVPPNTKDPTGSKRPAKSASNELATRLNAAWRQINDEIKKLTYTKVAVNQSYIVVNGLNVVNCYVYNGKRDAVEKSYIKRELRLNESFYDYDMGVNDLNRLNDIIADIYKRLFMVDFDGNLVQVSDGRQLWFMSGYVEPQYIRGTTQAFNNLTLQSAAYATATSSIEQVLTSPQWLRRIDIMSSREYTNIKGFTDQMITDTTRALTDGIALGRSPRDVSLEIQSLTGASKSKANLISQTELPGALRQANRDEGRQASIDYGIVTEYLWMSAFKATSRATHVGRSGEYHTAAEDEEFYNTGGNRFSCYCTQILTVMDSEGKPINTLAQKKVLKIKKAYLQAA